MEVKLVLFVEYIIMKQALTPVIYMYVYDFRYLSVCCGKS